MNNFFKKHRPDFRSHSVTLYLIGIYAIGFVISMVDPVFYYMHLAFDVNAILHGEIWRLVTYVFQPLNGNFIYFALECFICYFLGQFVEQLLGTQRYVKFILTGFGLNALSTLAVYLLTLVIYGMGVSIQAPLSYLNESMIILVAVMCPDLQFRLEFLIPIKGKHLLIIEAVLLGYSVIKAFMISAFTGLVELIFILIAFSIVPIFYFGGSRTVSVRQIRRRREFKRSYREGWRDLHSESGNAIHRCCICGRTELDSPDLEFRFCSKCTGYKEYCRDHLFTHVHS